MYLQREIECKGAAFRGFALQPDFASEQGGEFPGYGKPETRASVFSRGPGIRLLEGLKDETLLFRRDTDARCR